MSDMRRVHAEQLVSSLELSLPPVAIAFCDVVPDDVPMFQGVVPAGCAFWSQATSRTFATAARDHALCAIGIHTHNLSGAAASQPDELHASLKAMMGLDYVREEEIAAIPVMPRPLARALYGPLADFPVQPKVVLVFAHAQHGLILSEAVARVDGGTPPAMGRPACAIVPHVLNQQRAALSLGCCRARAYLDALKDDVALWALPAHRLDQYCGQIAAFASEPYRVSWRPHCLGGWGLWDAQVGFRRRCESARSGWSRSTGRPLSRVRISGHALVRGGQGCNCTTTRRPRTAGEFGGLRAAFARPRPRPSP